MAIPIGETVSGMLAHLNSSTGYKWTSQLSSRGFIIYRKKRENEIEEAAVDYNKWRSVCCEYFNVTYTALDNELKKSNVVTPRHWCWYMMVSVSMVNIDTLVKLLMNQKNRTSILHAVRKIHSLIYRKRPDDKSVKVFQDLMKLYYKQ